MNKIFEGLLELVYPTYCAGCGQHGQSVCPECLNSLPLIESKFCLKCGKPCNYLVEECRECRGKKFFFSQARSLGLYKGKLRDLVHKFKYGNSRALADVFAGLLVERVERKFFEVDLITCVPLSGPKRDERGFNQAQLLAEKIAQKVDVPFLDLILQERETQDQSRLQAAERRKNVKGVFSVHRDQLPKAARIILVDDVFTTGSTVNECSRVLKKAGADSIRVATIARSTQLA